MRPRPRHPIGTPGRRCHTGVLPQGESIVKEVRYEGLSMSARAAATLAAVVACVAVMAGVLGVFMSASGESLASLAGLESPQPASAVVQRPMRTARPG